MQYIAGDQKAVKILIMQGHDIGFKFVHDDGIPSQFGKFKCVFAEIM